MPTAHLRSIQVYRTPNGKEPFNEWLKSIPDTKTRARVRAGLEQLRLGNFGNVKAVGEGVLELRFHFGVGYRQHTDISPQTLAAALSNRDTPLIDALGTVLKALGYQLSIPPLVDENADLVLTTDKPGMTNTTVSLSEEPAAPQQLASQR